MTELQLENLSCQYQNFYAVKGVNLHIKGSGVYGILGANGCGKSTLLRAICGLQPFTGTCLVNGKSISQLSSKKKGQTIAYLGQNTTANLHLPSVEVVAMGFYPFLAPFEKPSAKQYQQAQAALESLSIGQLAQQDFLTLSGGQQQLVFFARTLARPAQLLILDEADSAVDFQNHHKMMAQLRHHVQKHQSIALFCTHQPDIALQYADHLLIMQKGKILHQLEISQCSDRMIESALQDIYSHIRLAKQWGQYLVGWRDTDESEDEHFLLE